MGSSHGKAPAGGTRIVLLRAVNVGGAKLPMADLRAIAADLGATDVRTYIASGNLLCTIPGSPDGAEVAAVHFDRALEQAVQARFGFFREAISRTVTEVQAALDAHPFEVVQPKFSYVTFLLRTPSPHAVADARRHETGEDRWDVIGRELHIRYAQGAGRPQMKDAAIGRSLGVPGTARNLNTVRALIDLAS